MVWIATANSLSNIPKPILSRFSVVNVDQARGRDAEAVVQSVWRSIRSSKAWGVAFVEYLSDDVIHALANKESREIKRVLLQVCGRIAKTRSSMSDELLAITVFDLNKQHEEAVLVLH